MRPVPEEAVELIKSFEGFSPTVYRCVGGYDTIGYGHLVKDRAAFPHPITKEEALLLLRCDINKAARAVLRLIPVPLTDGQYGALVSFTFNLGGGALQRSTMRMMLFRGEYDNAAAEFRKWVWAGGKKQKGLVRRRAAEQAMFLQAQLITTERPPTTAVINVFGGQVWNGRGEAIAIP
jgi:lysozyme